MWRLKSFMPKEHGGIEGRTIDIGNLKVHIQSKIAEGGFSCVYFARDVNHPTKPYALKHMICNDGESLDLAMKEISVMKLLRGHPNVVSIYDHTILDMGRTKEVLLVMEYCDTSLVKVLDSRGAGYFEEKQILLIFRDVCNAVFAMHSHSPPIAHRDLKAENILKGFDGLWKLCDFGSISTNHQRFEKPEEMGIEEDNIRKNTTPAYRAPEMWDLFRRELINEKVDIWALGCLLYRICYFKSAFDGESKLQILNGNYHIPELPKYSSSMTDLIRNMLQASPDTRPDITQVWFGVNEWLPAELQKSLPDRPAGVHVDGGFSSAARKSPAVLHGNPPSQLSSKEQIHNPSLLFLTSNEGRGPLGAFWTTQHAKIAHEAEDKGGPPFDGQPTRRSNPTNDRRRVESRHQVENNNFRKQQNTQSAHRNSVRKVDYGPPKDNEISFLPQDAGHSSSSQPEKTVISQDETVNTFMVEFDTRKSKVHASNNNSNNSAKEEALEAEVKKLKEQLKQANLQKAEITSKYEKLCAICRSQRQEIQELKQSISARTTPNRDDSKTQNPSGSRQSVTHVHKEKIEGTISELQEGLFPKSSSIASSNSWQAFAEEPKPQLASRLNTISVTSLQTTNSIQTANGCPNKWTPFYGSTTDRWSFGTDNFTAAPAGSQISKTSSQGNNSQRFGNTRSGGSQQASQPAGWAGF